MPAMREELNIKTIKLDDEFWAWFVDLLKRSLEEGEDDEE